MKLIRNISVVTLVFALLSTVAFGVENSKSADFNCNSSPPSGFNLFHPTTGYLIGYYDSAADYITTRVNFSYTSTAVRNISAYNADEKYAGVDIKDVGNGFDAYSITSTAPNVKTDIETNSGHNYYNEAEIVILGTLSANRTYNMNVSWRDYRQGYLSDVFSVNAELSNKPIAPGFDYNVISGGWKTLVQMPYGANRGYP